MNRAALSLIALACLLSAETEAWAAKSGDEHDGPAKAAAHAPSAKPKSEPEPKPAAVAPGSMDQLRDKLAARLGAVKAPEANNPNVLRVANKTEPAESGQISVQGAGPLPARKAKPAHPAALVGGSHRAPQATGALAAIANAGHGAPGGEAHWAYNGDTGPETWGRMKPEFSKCSTGSRQSPIDIRSGIQVQLAPIQFEYQPTGFSVIDNGHTVQVNLPTGNGLSINGRRYDLLQFHFHRPSEERVNGRQFDMVVHLVHKDPEGRLAVVAVLLERGSAQGLIQSVWNALPLEKGEEVPAAEAIDLNQLLPADKRYYTYMGSLTTPPCSEGVLWMVMKQPVQIAPDQLAIFARLYPMNARPIQPGSGRLIKESN